LINKDSNSNQKICDNSLDSSDMNSED